MAVLLSTVVITASLKINNHYLGSVYNMYQVKIQLYWDQSAKMESGMPRWVSLFTETIMAMIVSVLNKT